MPAVAAPTLAGLGAAAVAAEGLAFYAFIKAFAVTLILGAISRGLSRDPDDPSLAARNMTVRSPDGPRQVIYGQARVGGQLTYARGLDKSTSVPDTITISRDGRTIPTTRTVVERVLAMIVTVAGHEVEEIGQIRFNDEVLALDAGGVEVGRFAGYVRVLKRLGTQDDTAFPELIAMAGSGYTAQHRQRGCAKFYVEMKKNNDLWQTGIPNVTAIVKGKRVYDPRTGVSAWSDNPALCIADYLCTPRSSGGMGAVYETEIDEPALIAAANVCDETVALAAGGTEKRYTLNGAFLVSETPQSIIERMLSAMAGRMVYVGGRWRILAGAYQVPTVTLTDSDARGPVKTQTRLSRAEIFNAVRGVFVSSANAWQPTDFPPIVSATYESQDSGERIYRDIELPFTGSASMAQRLAKIELERARQQISHEFPANLRGLLVQPGDTVMITSAAKGWSAKSFEVVNLQFSVYDDANGAPALGVDLSLRETAAAVYDWNSGEELAIDPAPDTLLANPFSPVAPGIVSVVEGLYETTGSAGVKTRAWVGLGVIEDGSVWDYQIEHSPAGQNDWTAAPTSRSALIAVDELAPGTYDFRARAINELGVASAWSAIYTKNMLGLTAPPADVTNFTVRAMGGAAWVTLDRHPDLDVIQGGRIILRWSPQASPSWNEGSLLSQDGWPGDSVMIVAPLYAGTYMAKARDSSGNLSVNAVNFTITDANLTGYTTLATLTEHATFSGTKVGLAVTAGELHLSGASVVDAIADVDAVADWDAEGGVAMEGTYSFNTTMNLGSSQTVRLFPHQRGTNEDSAQLWDDRPLTIDDWADIDGAVIDDVESTIWVRTTTGDPTGSPTWGAWHPLMGPADYTFWGAQFELRFVSSDQTHNRFVDQLSVAAKN